MYDAVNAKTKIKLAVISDQYVADMLKNLGMESQGYRKSSDRNIPFPLL